MSKSAARFFSNKSAKIESHINHEHQVELLEVAYAQRTISQPDFTNVLVDIDRGNSHE